MLIDDFLKKQELKITFTNELKVDQETFINKMKEVTDINFRTIFFLVADNFLSSKIKYVGNFTKNQAELRERTFPYKRFRAGSTIKLNFKYQDEMLHVKTDIQGISYVRFILSSFILTLLLILSFLLLFELEFLPIVLFAIISYFYIFLSFKYSKANVQRIKNELNEYYKQIEKQNNIHSI
jgi:Flp pilus assembly protein TadB